MPRILFQRKDKILGFTLQQDQRDCGVACLVSLVRYYGGDTTFEQVRRWCGADLTGTSLLGLREAAKALGFEAEGCEADLPSLIAHGQPTILHVQLDGGLEHYVVWYNKPKPATIKENTKKTFLIGDPALGLIEWTEEELQKRWQSGICLTLEPNNHFENKTETTQQKWAWIRDLAQPDYQILLISAILGVLVAGLGLAMSIYSQQLIDKIIPSHKADKLIVATILVVVLLLARVGLTMLRQILLLRQSRDFGLRMNNAFFDKLLHLPKSFFDTRKIGDFVARLNDTRRIQGTISTLAGGLLVDLLLSLSAFGLLFYYDWQIGVISLLILPAYFFLIYRQNKNMITAQTNVMVAYSLSESNYINTIQGIADIKNRNKESFFGQINQLLYSHFQENVYQLGVVQTKLSTVASLAAVGFIALVLSLTLQKVHVSQMQLGEMTAVLGAISMLLPSVSSLALISVPINEAKVAFERMHEYIKNTKSPPTIDNSSTNLVEKQIKLESIRLENVSFRFAGKKQQLKDINMVLQRGRVAAVVGESGGGKSLICQIIQNFYEPESGRILLNDNLHLQQIDNQQWRAMISVVPQQVHLFNGTVLDNICLSNSPEEIQEAANLLVEYGFAPYLDGLPQGIYTIVGEEGVSLSGGQRQLIGLARALCYKPQLLIMDEATAALDRHTEQFVLDLVKRLRSDMAVLFITHRLHTLKGIADHIYVLEKSTFVEEGSHTQLLQSQNMYSDYWKSLVA